MKPTLFRRRIYVYAFSSKRTRSKMNALGNASWNGDSFFDQNDTTALPKWYVPGPNDVVLRQGTTILNHQGNLNFRALIALNRACFANIALISNIASGYGLSCDEVVKAKQREVAVSVVRKWRSQQPVGNFLLFDGSNSQLLDIGNEKAIGMTLMALDEENKNRNTEECAPSQGQNIVSRSNATTDHDSKLKTRSEEVRGAVDDELTTQGKTSDATKRMSPKRERLDIIFPRDDVVRVELPESTREGPLASVSDIVFLPSSAIERLPATTTTHNPSIDPNSTNKAPSNNAEERDQNRKTPVRPSQTKTTSLHVAHSNTAKHSVDDASGVECCRKFQSSDPALLRPQGIVASKKFHPHDVLFGKQNNTANHIGNKEYFTVCGYNQQYFDDASPSEQQVMPTQIVDAVRSRSPPGRFLERKGAGDLWYWHEMSKNRAIALTVQIILEMELDEAIKLPLSAIPGEFSDLIVIDDVSEAAYSSHEGHCGLEVTDEEEIGPSPIAGFVRPNNKRRIGQSCGDDTEIFSRSASAKDEKIQKRRITDHVCSNRPKPSSPKLLVERLGRRVTTKPSVMNMIPHKKVTDNDVLCGKGGQSIHHHGNIQFRKWAEEMKPEYSQLSKAEKTPYSWKLVRKVLDAGGRLLEKDDATGKYYVIVESDARLKASQALREEKGRKKKKRIE